MAGAYKVSLSIKVDKVEGGEVIESEVFYFDSLSFALMSFFSSEFFELIKKLQKSK